MPDTWVAGFPFRSPIRTILLGRALASVPLFILISVGAASAEPPVHASVAEIVAKASPAVVSILTLRPVGHPVGHPAGGLSKTPPKDGSPEQQADDPQGTAAEPASNQSRTAIGSGFIFDPAGYIGTNKHLIAGATAVFVTTADGVRYPARIVGMTAQADIALLRIDAGHPLPFLSFGESDKMRVGDPVIAIGDPFGFDTSVSAGIISAVNRNIVESPFDDYLQTDAALNHGNSGGPLLNLSGEIIGMASVIVAPGPGSAGVGFAVPSNALEFVFPRLIKTGHVAAGRVPFRTTQITWPLQQAFSLPDREGALVLAVSDPDDIVPRGEIGPGDVIRSFNGQTVTDSRDLARRAAHTEVGSDATLTVSRNGKTRTVHMKLLQWPEAPPIELHDGEAGPLGLTLAAGKGKEGGSVVTVDSVDPAGSAAECGIKKGDIILRIQTTAVTAPDQVSRLLGEAAALKHAFAAVLLRRDKKLLWVALAIPT